MKKHEIFSFDLKLIGYFRRLFLPVSRVAIFLIYFWFGILKIFNLSPAGPLAQALIDRTIGHQYFNSLYVILAVFECVIGVLFLFPKLTRIVIPLLFIHMIIVCSPLLLVPDIAWNAPFVPSLEGQYIIKNTVIIAVAIGIAASATPLVHRKRNAS
jgi:uncharacterized membrane protein YkgB